MAISDKQVDAFLAKQFEGKLFVEIGMTAIQGDNFNFTKHFYTVLDGIVYSVNNGEKYATGDTIMNVKIYCKKIGKYDPLKSYKPTTSNYSYAQIKRIVKL